MKTLDLVSGLFWLLTSVVFFVASLRLGTGTMHNPGMGFVASGAAGILGILSISLFLEAFFEKGVAAHEPLFAGTAWKRVLFVLMVLTAYSVMMPVLGYLIGTFILMSLLFWVLEKKKIGFALLSSVLATLITYFVFSKWLNCRFPDGFFGF